MNSLDLLVQNYFYLNHTPTVTQFMYVLSGLFDPSLPIISVILFSALLVYLVRGVEHSWLFVLAMITGWVSVYILKYLFDVNRPLDGVVVGFGQSFPSGHTTIATVFFVMIMYLFRPYLRGFLGAVLNFFCVACILAVGFSRIYLGVHWMSDVLAGLCLGVLISYASIKVFKKLTL